MRLTKNLKPIQSQVIYQRSDDIEMLHLPFSLESILKKAKIDTVGKFYGSKRRRFSKIKGVGKKTSWFFVTKKRNIKLAPLPTTLESKTLAENKSESQINKYFSFSLPEKISNNDPIDILGLPLKTENTLKINGIKTLEELNIFTQEEILKIHNIGLKTMNFLDLVKKHIAFKLSSNENKNIDELDQTPDIIKETSILNESLIDSLIERAGDTRSMDILKRRFGLSNGERETLEEIGRDYGVTRERIRQIQKKALRKIQHPSTRSREAITVLVTKMLEENNIVISDSEADILVGKFFNNYEFDGSSFLDLLSELNWIQRNEIGDVSFYTTGKMNPSISIFMKDVYIQLKSSGKSLSIDEISKLLITLNCKYSEWRNFEILIERLCNLDPRIEERTPGKFTLYSHHSKTDDWAFLIREVLEKEDTPLHFTEIADNVNDALSNFNNKHIDVRRVHSILIERDEFSHSGVKGTYGLTEWGFRKETTAELIKECIKKAGFPLHWKQIFNYVSKYKDTKHANILAILNNKDIFTKLGRGTFGLKEKQFDI